MPYPHQPGSIFFDGANAYEAYMDEKPDREEFLTKRLAERGEELERLKTAIAFALDHLENDSEDKAISVLRNAQR